MAFDRSAFYAIFGGARQLTSAGSIRPIRKSEFIEESVLIAYLFAIFLIPACSRLHICRRLLGLLLETVYVSGAYLRG
ncbi:MAG: hypothetical protein K2Y39_28230 [Candidatus Obscuribacterales bacterium]|nr:hypothetical protein [Candidatus Obscuribacterales bacterium]